MPDTEPGRTAAQKLRAMAPVGVAVGKAVGRALVDRYVGKGATADISEAAVDSIAEAAGSFRFDEDPFVTKFEKVVAAIEGADKNFLVVVDDIDRLHSEELLALFKAIRLLGRFDRVHYLLADDEQTILDVLESSDIANSDRRRAIAFLEKSFSIHCCCHPPNRCNLSDISQAS
jgi:KAP family P-loop domain